MVKMKNKFQFEKYTKYAKYPTHYTHIVNIPVKAGDSVALMSGYKIGILVEFVFTYSYLLSVQTSPFFTTKIEQSSTKQ